MKEQEMPHEEALVRYITMPEQLDEALAGLSESDLDLARADGAWTIRKIVHHLVDADDLTKNIIKAALGKPGCAYELDWYDPENTWAETLEYARRPIAPDIALLRANHRHIEQLLSHLPGGWERHVLLKRSEGQVTQKMTVGQLMSHQTRHALHHIAQIRATREAHRI